MKASRVVYLLLGFAVVLLVAFFVTAGVAVLLGELGDTGAAIVFRRVAIGMLAAGVTDLVCLVLALAVIAVSRDDP